MGKLMEYKGYHAIVEYSDEDEVFIGKVFGLADVILFDGESISELKNSFQDAVDDYLSLCEEIGKKINNVIDEELKSLELDEEKIKKLLEKINNGNNIENNFNDINNNDNTDIKESD